MASPGELAALWMKLDDQERDIVASILALLAALDGAPPSWWGWARDVLAVRIPNAADIEDLGDMAPWREAIEGWE